MAKIGLYDKVLDKLHQRRQGVRQKLYMQYKGQKPFRMEPIPNDKMVQIYENMNDEDVVYAVQKYGEDTVRAFVGDMEKLASRRV